MFYFSQKIILLSKKIRILIRLVFTSNSLFGPPKQLSKLPLLSSLKVDIVVDPSFMSIFKTSLPCVFIFSSPRTINNAFTTLVKKSIHYTILQRKQWYTFLLTQSMPSECIRLEILRQLYRFLLHIVNIIASLVKETYFLNLLERHASWKLEY